MASASVRSGPEQSESAPGCGPDPSITPSIPASALRGALALPDVEALLQAHGASIRSVDDHHWQISHGSRRGLWLLGDPSHQAMHRLDASALARLRDVLRQVGLIQEAEARGAAFTVMGAAILWIGADTTRVYWINDHSLTDGATLSLGHWLQGELSLHRAQRPMAYLMRILGLLERIERALLIAQRAEPGSLPASERGVDSLEQLRQLLDQERPDLWSRVVAMLTLEGEPLDDARLFAIAKDYLSPHPPHG